MPLELADYEKGQPYKGDYAAELARLKRRLARVQSALIVQRARSIILFEGWKAAGKGGVIRQLASSWDQRWCEVWPVGLPNQIDQEHHFLKRFWLHLPPKGTISILDGSWYGRVLGERVEGGCGQDDWNRAYDEINEFEAQQRDAGTLIIKIFLHITPETQDRRFKERLQDPWKRWMVGPEDFHHRACRDAFLSAYAEMFQRCDTHWAPWTVVDGNRKKAARIKCLTTIAEQLEKWIELEPAKISPEVQGLAMAAWGEEPTLSASDG